MLYRVTILMANRVKQRLMFLERLRHIGLIPHPGSFKYRTLQQANHRAESLQYRVMH